MNDDDIPLASEMLHGGFKQSGYGKDLSIYAVAGTRPRRRDLGAVLDHWQIVSPWEPLPTHGRNQKDAIPLRLMTERRITDMRRSWSLGLGLLGLCLVGDSPCCIPKTAVAVARTRTGAADETKLRRCESSTAILQERRHGERHRFADGEGGRYGEKEEDAVQNAVEAARDKVARFLASNYGETQYKPSAKELLDKKIVDLDKKQIDTAKLPLSDNPQRATLEVTVTAEQVKLMRPSAWPACQ